MISRRRFIRQSSLAGMAVSTCRVTDFFKEEEADFSFESAYIKVRLRRSAPVFSFFSTDSLGGRRFPLSPLLAGGEEAIVQAYESRSEGSRIGYFLKNGDGQTPAWECVAEEKRLTLRTAWKEGMGSGKEGASAVKEGAAAGMEEEPVRKGGAPTGKEGARAGKEGAGVGDAFTLLFSQPANHCTVLGQMTGEKQMKFPCVLHFPGLGTFRVTCSDPGAVFLYDADRNVKEPFVRIALPAADRERPVIEYRFESVAIYPEIGAIRGDARFDGFRRNYINIFQVNPRIRALANNSASDACAFTLFLYAEMARHTPALVGELTAMGLVRDTLTRYLGDMKGYGQLGYAGWRSEYDSSDSFPSLIISACYYIRDSGDLEWARKNYPGIRGWAEKVMSTDKNGDGIVEYGYSGNSGSWGEGRRPANWWDAVGFGHDDAYSNILVYHALRELSKVAEVLKEQGDSESFSGFAARLRGNYFRHFYHPETGVLAGWKSADGQLHDYYFLFVNSMAICYEVIDPRQGKEILRVLLRKMREVGFTDFRLGLPGNLIPIRGEDYSDKTPRWGFGGTDGKEAFQVYENGGASGCYAYYTLHALYKSGMRKEAEEILFPMLESYKTGDFEGSCEKGGMTKDWKTWKGECWGYEGFLVDNYLALLAVLDYGGEAVRK